MSRMLWGFNITPKVRDGKPVAINPDKLTQGFVCMPDTFECEITSRDEKRARLIREDWEGSKKEYIDILTGQLKEDITLENMSVA
jgi:hypothetical protein